jgi:histidinol-phosphate aminotransferase
MIDPILQLARPEILALTPYSSARKESAGGRLWLDANENPETPSADGPLLNRYPEPQPVGLVSQLAALYGVAPANLLVTRGSDEGIDLLLRAFCRAGRDAILITPPTYGMYAVSAAIQGARVVSVPLVREQDFSLDADAVIRAAGFDASVKLVFLCSPNNPTGQLLARDAVVRVTRELAGRAVIVVDEAYIEFSGQPSLVPEIAALPNLVVLRTLSKAHGLAGARVGSTIACPAIISLLQKIIAPYPIPEPVIMAASAALIPAAIDATRSAVLKIIAERERLASALKQLPSVRRVWPSDANFLLVGVDDVPAIMTKGRATGIIWRDRSKDVSNALRITIGTRSENDATIAAFATA